MGKPDLASSELSSFELRDFKNRQALLLLSDGFYFYENVAPDSALGQATSPSPLSQPCTKRRDLAKHQSAASSEATQ